MTRLNLDSLAEDSKHFISRLFCYISRYRLPSARYHGLRMRQNLVQWIPQIERHMTCVDQSEASKE